MRSVSKFTMHVYLWLDTLHFNQAVYLVNESDGTANLTLEFNRPLRKDITVRFNYHHNLTSESKQNKVVIEN